jgi:RecB family exonuclease
MAWPVCARCAGLYLAAPFAALAANGWWQRSIAGTGDDGAVDVDAAFPRAARGRHAESQRESSALTEFDGYVPEAGPALDPAASGNVYSVTEFEKAAECPFRFFLRRGLGLRPVDERERDRDVWLDPLTRGSELHDVYAMLLRKVRDEKRWPTLLDTDWLLAYARQRLAKINAEMPAPTLEILERETKDFLDDVQLFVEAEVEAVVATAVGLEVSFGRPLDGDDEPLARPEPVTISLGGGMTLNIAGRIDRIDKVGDATFEVVDYKTGGYWRDRWKGTFAGGTRLQHALYGLAAVELLKARHQEPKIRGGVYYFSSHKGRGERVRIDAPDLASLGAVLADLREVIATGQFIRTVDENRCNFCDFVQACGGRANKQASIKLADPNTDAFRRLNGHI